MNLKTSIALCTYNGSKHIIEQLKSLQNQTKLPTEIIICDDNSTDNTLLVIKNFFEKSLITNNANKCNYTIHKNQKNIGYIKNFQKCISLCTGDIIFLCDQDDVWLPNKLETLYNHLVNNKDISLVFSNAYITDEHLNITKTTLWNSIRFNKKMIPILKTKEAYKYLIKRNYATGATIAFKKDLANYIYPIPKDFVHDHYITFIASMISKIEPIDECLIYYRQHENQSIGVKNSNYINTIIRLIFKKRKPSYKNNETLNVILEKEEVSKQQKHYIKHYLEHSFERERIYNTKLPKNILLAKKNFKKYFQYPNALINIIRDILKL